MYPHRVFPGAYTQRTAREGRENARHLNTATPELCRWCGEPLPPRTGLRGRPAVTHPGECRRRYHNRHKLNYRIAKFRAAHRLTADRAVGTPWAATAYGADEVDLLPDTGRFVRLYGAYDNVHGPALIDAVDAWEKAERVWRLVEDSQKLLLHADRAAEREALSARLAALTPEERAERVRKAVARRIKVQSI